MRSLVVLLLLLGMTAPAFAYVDPGTGMLAIQGLIALAIAVFAFIRHPFKAIARWWRRLLGKSENDA